MTDRRLDAGLDLLDRLVIDRDDVTLGRVDDLELAAALHQRGRLRQIQPRGRAVDGHVEVRPAGQRDALHARYVGVGIDQAIAVRAVEIDDRQRRAFEVATEANQAAAEQMVAGNPVSSADAAAQWVIEQAGFGELIERRGQDVVRRWILRHMKLGRRWSEGHGEKPGLVEREPDFFAVAHQLVLGS